MDGEIGKLDRLTLKSLASDAKIDILQRLAERRKTPSELSREISTAPSTIVQHLKELETSGLVKRQDTRHKWIYYELTDKGASIFKPRIPFHLMLSLALAIIITSIGAWSYVSLPLYELTATADIGMKETVREIEAGAIAPSNYTVMAEATAPLNYTPTQSDYDPTIGNRPLFAVVATIGALISIALLYTIYKAKKRFE